MVATAKLELRLKLVHRTFKGNQSNEMACARRYSAGSEYEFDSLSTFIVAD